MHTLLDHQFRYFNLLLAQMTITAFDFDGTITTKDTLLTFIKFSKGTWPFLVGFFLYSPLLIAYKLRLYPNWKVKQHIFSYFYKGTSIDQFNQWGAAFSERIAKIVRPRALTAIHTHQQEGCVLVIVSASVENWITPWAAGQGIDRVLATQVEIDQQGKLTGKFLTKNCYGREKVNRILEVFPRRADYKLLAYGDSRGDLDPIEFADEGYYHKFK